MAYISILILIFNFFLTFLSTLVRNNKKETDMILQDRREGSREEGGKEGEQGGRREGGETPAIRRKEK